jgi:acyl-CoA dehydrogenase
MPVAITVEGANILTRSLMIFGQGAVRSHPYVLKEMDLARQEYSEDNLHEFDRVFMQHIGFVYHNAAAAFVHGLMRSSSVRIPAGCNPRLSRYYQHLSRFSAAFAAVADVSMLMMQSSLKRREMLSARLGDLLSMLYLGSMVLKHCEGEGCPEEDMPVVRWSMDYLLHGYQEAMHELLENFPNRLAALKLRLLVFPTGRHYEKPTDDLEKKVAELVSRDTPTRRRLIDGIYLEPTEHNPLGRLNALLAEFQKLEPLQKKLREAAKAGKVNAPDGRARIDAAEHAGVVSEDEAAQLRDYDERLMAIIKVDEFDFDDLAREKMPSP